MKSTSTIIQAFDGLLYADAFDCALTLDEIHRFSRLKISKTQLISWMNSESFSTVISQHSDFYFLFSGKEKATNRKHTMARAEKLCRRACRIAKWVHFVPFVRGIVLTGSVAANDADPEADIDFLVIVAESRLSFVFLVLGSLSRLSCRRLFCPNYYLAENHLTISRREFYVAREISQAKPLIGNAVDFFDANEWVQDYLPNGEKKTNHSRPITGSTKIKTMIEVLFNWLLNKRVIAKLDSLVFSRLSQHYKRQLLAVPTRVKTGFAEGRELRFHSPKRIDDALNRYKENQEKLLKHLNCNKYDETGSLHAGQESKPGT